MEVALSDSDIKTLLGGKCNLVTYDEIKNYKSMNELLGKYKRCVILYLTSENFGHWTCCYEYDNKIHFFDSYGLKPNGAKSFVPNHMHKRLNQDHSKLIELMLKSGKDIHFNQYKLQSSNPKVATCGRWVVFRLWYPDLSEEEFKRLFESRGISNDKLISQVVKINK